MNRTSALANLAMFSQGPRLLGRSLLQPPLPSPPPPVCLGPIHHVYHSRWGEGLLKCFDRKLRTWHKKGAAMNFAVGYSLVSLQLGCAAEQGLIFRVLGLRQARYTISLFSILYRGPFWTESL